MCYINSMAWFCQFHQLIVHVLFLNRHINFGAKKVPILKAYQRAIEENAQIIFAIPNSS